MGGDGLSNDSLHCINKRLVSETSVTQYLFRIEPSKKYTSNEYIDEGSDIKDSTGLGNKLTQCEIEEKHYQETLKSKMGTPIYYGQNILLKHIFSGSYVTLHSNKLSKQVGSVRIGLQDLDTECSIMKVMPSSRLKKIGDTVGYADSIVISNTKEDHYYLHVSEYLNIHDKGLEINGSETRTEWKPKLYVSDKKDSSLFSKSSVVSSGVVLSIFNSHVNGYLSASPKDIQSISRQCKMYTRGGNSNTLHDIPMDYNILDNEGCLRHEVYVETRSKTSFYTLWEIQRIQIFDSDPIVYYKDSHNHTSTVRIKNVATQQYLCVDIDKSSKLSLTTCGHYDRCIFYFESKSGVTDNTVVSTEDLLKIRTYKGKYIFPQKKEKDKGKDNKQSFVSSYRDNDNEYEFRVSDKIDNNSSTFELISRPKEITKIANQLSCLFSRLTSFYIYLQEWGNSTSNTKDIYQYDYDTSVETEKELEIEVQELTQSLNMIYHYLSSEISAKGNLNKYSEMRSVKSSLLEDEKISYDTKKQLLIEQNIMDILYKIAELIVFKTIDSLRTVKYEHQHDNILSDKNTQHNNNGLISLHQLYNIGMERFDCLPQLIARKRLESPLMLIFKIMHLSVWDNEDCSNYLALKFKFFQDLIDFYPKESMDVMKEVAKNITNQEEEYIKFYEPWIQMLEEISEKQGNIKKQIFLLNTLSGLILDESNNTPIEVFQKRIYDSLFQPSSGNKNGFLKFGLNTSNGAPEDDQTYYQVMFISSKSRHIL